MQSLVKIPLTVNKKKTQMMKIILTLSSDQSVIIANAHPRHNISDNKRT